MRSRFARVGYRVGFVILGTSEFLGQVYQRSEEEGGSGAMGEQAHCGRCGRKDFFDGCENIFVAGKEDRGCRRGWSNQGERRERCWKSRKLRVERGPETGYP